MVRLYMEEGQSARQLAKRFGYDHHRVTDIIREQTGVEALRKGYSHGGVLTPGTVVRQGQDESEGRVCADCRLKKPLDEFVKNRGSKYGGYMIYCRSCWTNNRTRKAWLKRGYGITEAQYDEMVASQDGKCRICRSACKTGQRLSVDHCHKTGKVRGLLCKNCNNAIGLFKDDPELLRRAIEYLEL